MESYSFPYRLYLVTDEAACLGRDLIQVTEAAIKGGVDLVQLREKQMDKISFLKRAWKMKDLLDRYGVPLLINDQAEIAQEIGCAGVHVGQGDMPPQEIRKLWPACDLLGLSIEKEEELQEESVTAADYLGLSPVYRTATKQDTLGEWGLEGVRHIRQLTNKALVAIGGIHLGNVAPIIEAGADCIAVVSVICSAENPAKAAEQLRNKIEQVSR